MFKLLRQSINQEVAIRGAIHESMAPHTLTFRVKEAQVSLLEKQARLAVRASKIDAESLKEYDAMSQLLDKRFE